MAVGKSSRQRVKAVSENIAEDTVKTVSAKKEVKKDTTVKTSETKKTSTQKKDVKKQAQAKKPVVAKETKKDDMHVKKFESINGIYFVVPT